MDHAASIQVALQLAATYDQGPFAAIMLVCRARSHGERWVNHVRCALALGPALVLVSAEAADMLTLKNRHGRIIQVYWRDWEAAGETALRHVVPLLAVLSLSAHYYARHPDQILAAMPCKSVYKVALPPPMELVQ